MKELKLASMLLKQLLNLVSPNIKMSLTDAHCKLSDYYYQYDASPFYTWAACMYMPIICMTIPFLIK
jgi:hypothetical protein